MIDSNIIDAFNSSWKGALRHIIVIGYLSTAPGVLSQNSFLQGNSNKVTVGIPYPENTPNPFCKSPQKQDLLVWDEEGKRLSEEFNTGSFYWYGTDRDGCPTLWYRMERMEWSDLVLKKRLEYTHLVLKNAFEMMPPNVNGINFVLLLDDFRPSHILKHPRLGPSFLKSFVDLCPAGYLKRAVMVTGTTGRVFYKIAKAIGPKGIVDRITVVQDRSKASLFLLDSGVIERKDDIPIFLGGIGAEHPDEITRNFRGMMSHLFTQFEINN